MMGKRSKKEGLNMAKELSAFEKAGGTYRQEGDYFVPNIKDDDEGMEPLRKYGMMRRTYLHKHQGRKSFMMSMKGTLEAHLREVDQNADEMLKLLMDQMLEKDPAPDKATDQMGWVRHMNSIKAVAEEIVLNEIVYEGA